MQQTVGSCACNVIANAKNKAAFESRRAELEKHQAEELTKAQARAEKMQGATVPIVTKAGEEEDRGKTICSVPGAR